MIIVYETPESLAKRERRKNKIYDTLQQFMNTEDQIIVPELMESPSVAAMRMGAENAMLADRSVMFDVDILVNRVRESAGLAMEAMGHGDRAYQQKNRKAENMWRTLYEQAVCNMFITDEHVRVMRNRCLVAIRDAGEKLEVSGHASRLETTSRKSRMDRFMESMLEKYHIDGINKENIKTPKRVARTMTSWNLVIE